MTYLCPIVLNEARQEMCKVLKMVEVFAHVGGQHQLDYITPQYPVRRSTQQK